MAEQLVPKGTKAEQELFMKVRSRYDRSRNDLETRISDFDSKDELFRTYIDEAKWPYRAQVADPATFTFLIEKTSRLISNKLRGKVIPREGSDWLKAKIANELLNYDWDNATVGGSMIQKWALMDINTRKYGAAFGICKYRYEVPKGSSKPTADNPEFEVCTNRDVLVNPDHADIKDWFMYRRYVTVEELEEVNELARSGPKYKNLDILKLSLKDKATETGDRRDVNYLSRNKAMKGLSDTLGEDRYSKYIELVTYYTPRKIVYFAPKHGVILREEDNSYGEIPVVHLRYYMIDDDIYGLSEIEPIEKLQRVENALISQYLDTVNSDLYPPLLIRSNAVQMHTIEFGPNKKWIVNDPNSDIKRFDTSTAATSQFTSTVSFIISRMSNAVGETSQGISNTTPFNPDKTATEVRDQATQRLARDNFNQIFLAEALKKQMLFWLNMESRFLTKNKLIRVMGKESLAFFKKQMMASTPKTDIVTGQPMFDMMGQPQMEQSPYGVDQDGVEDTPIFPVEQGEDIVPKFQMDATGEVGEMIIEPKDLKGTFDYIPDVESMSIQREEDAKMKLQMLSMISNPAMVAQMAQEGVKPKLHDLLVEAFEDVGFKDADRFFETVGGGISGGQAISPLGTGAGIPQGGLQTPGNVPEQGIPAGVQAPALGQAQPGVPQPIGG